MCSEGCVRRPLRNAAARPSETLSSSSHESCEASNLPRNTLRSVGLPWSHAGTGGVREAQARRGRGVGWACAGRALGVGEASAGAHPNHRMRNCARPLRRRSPRMRSTAKTFESPSASASASRPPTPCTSTAPGSNLASMRGRLAAADSPAIGRGRLGGGASPPPLGWSVASPSRNRQGTATVTPESRRVAALSGGAPRWLRAGGWASCSGVPSGDRRTGSARRSSATCARERGGQQRGRARPRVHGVMVRIRVRVG